MKTIALLEKNKILYGIIKDFLPSHVVVKEINDANDFMMNYSKINPSLIILDESLMENETLDFCKRIREKYSLLMPILLVLNFYSTVDLERLKNLGIQYIVKPFSKETIIEKIETFFKPLAPLKTKEPEITEKTQFSSLMENLKPIIREEVKAEIVTIFKQVMEVVEKRND